MHKRRIAVVIAIGLFVLTTFSPVSFAQDQTQSLIEAAKKGDLEHVRDLLDKGADINATDTCGGTPLMWASVKGNTEIVKVLLGKAADINAKDNKGWNALMWASVDGHAEVVKVLLGEGADVSAKEKNGSTALKMASLMNHPEVVKLLKAHGAKETDKSKSLSDSDIWGIAVLLCISCALFVSGMVAVVRETRYGLTFTIFSMGIAAWFGALILTRGNYPFVAAVAYCPFLFLVISRLTVISTSRRQASPPCIWVRGIGPGQSRIEHVIGVIFGLVLIPFIFCGRAVGSLRPDDWMLLLEVLWTVFLVLAGCWAFFPRFQIFGNGLWQNGTMQPWDEFRSFSWTGKTKDGLGLKLYPKNTVLAEKRLLVRPQDREAVRQLLEAKLPDRSSGAEVRNT